MVLSEAEAEAQLAALRRQRDALDRSIADLTLYLELGRRLTAQSGISSGLGAANPRPVSGAPDGNSQAVDHDAALAEHSSAGSSQAQKPGKVEANPVAGFVSRLEPRGGSASTRAPSAPVREAEAAPATLRPDASESVLSEGVLARRYGRALIEAALMVLQEAGRPLHASEILAALTRQGFSLPGHDPVAALNTRLWKRSGSGGALTRMGDAVYALAQPSEA